MIQLDRFRRTEIEIFFGFIVLDCILVTCDAIPDLDPDDRLLLSELRGRHIGTMVESWRDADVNWADAKLCIIRSTWDYHKDYATFLRWIEHVASVTAIKNERHLLRWNSHKSYIKELAILGLPVIPTAWITAKMPCQLSDVCETNGWRDVVIKPARGAAAHNVRRVDGTTTDGQSHFELVLQGQDALVQPYLGSVTEYGERALVFFNGKFSHAVAKKPFDTVLAVSNHPSTITEATTEEVNVALSAVKAAPGKSLYARVDLLRDDEGSVCISELELIEPALYLGLHGSACGALADAIEEELSTVSPKQPLQTSQVLR
jgi:glutathione synthase/RimK-type ligase-like ATP-grasp enzyme